MRPPANVKDESLETPWWTSKVAAGIHLPNVYLNSINKSVREQFAIQVQTKRNYLGEVTLRSCRSLWQERIGK